MALLLPFGEGDFVAMAAIELSTGAIKVTVKVLDFGGTVFEYFQLRHAGTIGVVHSPLGIVGGRSSNLLFALFRLMSIEPLSIE
jgi:hypothetical protein